MKRDITRAAAMLAPSGTAIVRSISSATKDAST